MRRKFDGFPQLIFLAICLVLVLTNTDALKNVLNDAVRTKQELKDLQERYESLQKKAEHDIPAYAGEDTVVLNDNIPFFTVDDLTRAYDDQGKISVFTDLSELDIYGRTGTAMMVAGPETLADEEREEISEIYPSGWKQTRYEDLIDNEGWLYNRCHLLAHVLSELNAEPKNLMTCTRQMNAESMYYYEVAVANYIRETGNHVLYRVTPVYQNSNALADGVIMEALSLEEKGLEFCIFAYNVQDGIEINYSDGSSARKG